jgi:hypothetical protein
MNTKKKLCIEWANKWVEKTGKFPKQGDWLVNKNNAPVGYMTLSKLFNSYNTFRIESGHSIIKHNNIKNPVSIETLFKDCKQDYISEIVDTPCWLWQKTIDKGYAKKKY